MMDPQTIAIGLGLVASLLFSEAYGLAAGGMIVPGYFALRFDQPGDILLTLAAALVTFWIVSTIGKVAIVYGRRRIVLMILVGFVIGQLVRTALASGGAAAMTADATGENLITIIGCIIPGLIALWFDRQGLLETTGTVLTTSAVVRLSLVVLGQEMVV